MNPGKHPPPVMAMLVVLKRSHWQDGCNVASVILASSSIVGPCLNTYVT
jgi:hypothetical protein